MKLYQPANARSIGIALVLCALHGPATQAANARLPPDSAVGVARTARAVASATIVSQTWSSVAQRAQPPDNPHMRRRTGCETRPADSRAEACILIITDIE